MFETIAASVITSFLSSGAFGWLLRSWISERLKNAIKHEYDQKLEIFKTQLKAASDVELEQLKAKLQIAACERSVQYSHIYTQTAETLAEVYSRLVAFRDAVAHYVSSIEWSTDPPKEERRMIAGTKLQDFHNYYKPRRIFIPRPLDDEIAEFANGLYKISVEFKLGVEEGRDYRRGAPGDVDTWQKADDYINKKCPELLRSLEAGFQKHLGIGSP